MAIAYYVPPGIGNDDPQQQQHQQQQQNQPEGVDPRIVDIHHEHFHQDANNNNVMRRQQPQMIPNQEVRHNQLVSLFTGLVTELLAVFGNRNNASAPQENNNNRGQQQPQQQQQQSIRMRRHAAQHLPNIHIEQDNHPEPPQPPAAAPLPDLIPSPFRSLPDVISCEAGMSFRYNSSSAPDVNQADQQSENPHPRDRRPPVAPLSPSSSQHYPPTTMDFEVRVKLEMSVGQEDESSSLEVEEEEQSQVPVSLEESYRLEGARLRAIADSFERSRNSRRRIPSTQSTFELKIVISVAVPTVALVGLGFAYFRR